MHRQPIIALATLALAGLSPAATACGAPHLATVERAKAGLEGRDVVALSCIGEPLARLPADGAGEVWRFSSAQPRDALGRTVADPVQPAGAHDRACVADALVADGQVRRVTTTNRAGWGFGSIRACSALLAACTSRQ
jgi:hypothetical protein